MDFFRITLQTNRLAVRLSVVSGSFILSPLSYALAQHTEPVKKKLSRKEEYFSNVDNIFMGFGQEKTHEEFSSVQSHLIGNALFVPDEFLRQKEPILPINSSSLEANTWGEPNKDTSSSSLPWVIGGTLMSFTTVVLVAAPSIISGSSDIYASNQKPHLTLLDSISIYENTSGIILTAEAWDPGGGAVTFSIRGNDSSFFHIDSANGALSVKPGVTLDFDAAIDYNSDNQFTLTVVATNSLGAVSDSALTIQLLNVDDEAPEISVQMTTLTLDEGSTGQLTDILFVDDGTEHSDAQWIINGEDKHFFHLSGQGVLSLQAPFDYENAQDANMDNVYEVNVQALDVTARASNSLDFQIAVNNVWEPGPASLTLDMLATMTVLQSGFSVQLLDEISFLSSVLYRDVDGDGDSDSLIVFADDDGTSATGQQSSIMVAAFEDPSAANLSGLLFAYQDSGINYENIRSVSAVRSANGEQGHQVTVNTTALQTNLFLSDNATNRMQITSKVEKAVNQILLHFDKDNDGVYESFWQFDNTGLRKGGGDDSSGTTLISSELILIDGEKYATADLDSNGESDIIIYTPSTDSISVWLSDASGLSMTLATANNNPMYGAKLCAISSKPTVSSDIQGIFWFEDSNSNSLATFNDTYVDIFSVL